MILAKINQSEFWSEEALGDLFVNFRELFVKYWCDCASLWVLVFSQTGTMPIEFCTGLDLQRLGVLGFFPGINNLHVSVP